MLFPTERGVKFMLAPRLFYYCFYPYFIHFFVLLSSILWNFTVSVHGKA
jgi:hypothetical protein